VRERCPGQGEASTFGLGRTALRLGAADRSDAAFATRDALRRLMQIADRTFAADRPVIIVLRVDGKTRGELLLRIAIAPAQEIDDVERLDFAEQPGARVRFRALQGFDQQRERLEAFGNFLRPIDDFTDADDDGHAVFRNS